MENQDRTARGLDRRTFVAGAAAAGALAVAAGASMARAEEAAEAEEAPAEEAAPAAGETLECDVCVVGCGAAGFMASITAAQNGAKVITLEKGDNITAPNGVYVSGPFAVDTDAGSLYYSPYYDVPGFCYGLCIDSGYIAANEACAYAGVTA